jgi:hypothetical protein
VKHAGTSSVVATVATDARVWRIIAGVQSPGTPAMASAGTTAVQPLHGVGQLLDGQACGDAEESGVAARAAAVGAAPGDGVDDLHAGLVHASHEGTLSPCRGRPAGRARPPLRTDGREPMLF